MISALPTGSTASTDLTVTIRFSGTTGIITIPFTRITDGVPGAGDTTIVRSTAAFTGDGVIRTPAITPGVILITAVTTGDTPRFTTITTMPATITDGTTAITITTATGTFTPEEEPAIPWLLTDRMQAATALPFPPGIR